MATSLIGCIYFLSADSKNSDFAFTASQPSTLTHNCKHFCVPEAIEACAIAFDSIPRPVPTKFDHESARDYFAKLIEGSQGSLSSLTLDQMLNRIDNDELLRDEYGITFDRGHVILIAGKLHDGDQVFYQCLHGNAQPELLTREQLEESVSDTALLLTWKNQVRSPVLINVGSSLIAVDRVLSNLGNLGIEGTNSTSFTLRNAGKSAIVIDKNVKVTCRCAAVELDKDVCLEPGQEQEVKLSLITGGAESFRQSAAVKLSSLLEDESRFVELTVVGSRLPEISVVPEALDFANLSRGKKAVRVVRIGESTRDQFDILGVSVVDSVASHKVQVQQRKGGLRDHLVEVEISETSLASGEESVIELKTTSKHNPLISVPYKVREVALVASKPSVLSFGTLSLGKSRNQKVTLEAVENCRIASVRGLDLPQGVKLTFDKNNAENPRTMVVDFTLTPLRSGDFLDQVVLRVNVIDEKNEATTVDVIVECVARVA